MLLLLEFQQLFLAYYLLEHRKPEVDARQGVVFAFLGVDPEDHQPVVALDGRRELAGLKLLRPLGEIFVWLKLLQPQRTPVAPFTGFARNFGELAGDSPEVRPRFQLFPGICSSGIDYRVGERHLGVVLCNKRKLLFRIVGRQFKRILLQYASANSNLRRLRRGKTIQDTCKSRPYLATQPVIRQAPLEARNNALLRLLQRLWSDGQFFALQEIFENHLALEHLRHNRLDFLAQPLQVVERHFRIGERGNLDEHLDPFGQIRLAKFAPVNGYDNAIFRRFFDNCLVVGRFRRRLAVIRTASQRYRQNCKNA